MIYRIASAFLFVLVAFTVFAAAGGGGPTTTVTVTATPTATPLPASQCNTGPIQCCNSVQSSSNPLVGLLSATLNVLIQGLNVPVGITCSPLSVVGVGGNSCTSQPVCCQNNSFNGVIAIGCTPVNINL